MARYLFIYMHRKRYLILVLTSRKRLRGCRGSKIPLVEIVRRQFCLHFLAQHVSLDMDSMQESVKRVIQLVLFH